MKILLREKVKNNLKIVSQSFQNIAQLGMTQYVSFSNTSLHSMCIVWQGCYKSYCLTSMLQMLLFGKDVTHVIVWQGCYNNEGQTPRLLQQTHADWKTWHLLA